MEALPRMRAQLYIVCDSCWNEGEEKEIHLEEGRHGGAERCSRLWSGRDVTWELWLGLSLGFCAYNGELACLWLGISGHLMRMRQGVGLARTLRRHCYIRKASRLAIKHLNIYVTCVDILSILTIHEPVNIKYANPPTMDPQLHLKDELPIP